MKVSYGGAFTNIGKDYLAVAAAYDPKRGVTDDPNGLYEGSINKYAVRTFVSFTELLALTKFWNSDGRSAS